MSMGWCSVVYRVLTITHPVTVLDAAKIIALQSHAHTLFLMYLMTAKPRNQVIRHVSVRLFFGEQRIANGAALRRGIEVALRSH